MAYTDTLQTVRTAGIGREIQNEVVGTGDDSATSFDLDNGNVVASSYTLKYAASGSNDFTDLTETTHYTLDKDSGSIELTSAGVAELSTNILYADYTYSPKASDTLLSTFLEPASDEVDKLTNNYWGTPKTTTEIFDGPEGYAYPDTDEPYVSDYDAKDSFELDNKGVINIQGAYILGSNLAIGNAQRYDSVATTYTDVTGEANSFSGTAFQPFADTTAANDCLYIGCSKKFFSLNFILFTVGVTAGTNTIEYYDGSSWTSFTATESETGVLNFAAAGKLSWSSLSGWTTTEVNSNGTALYFVRIKANNTYSTEAKINHIYVNQDDAIDQEIPLYAVQFDAEGDIVLTNMNVPPGKRKLRIDYYHGYSSPPNLVKELTAIVASIMMFVNITGGSYDDATSFTLGKKSVSIGEVYVNVREVQKQLTARLDSLLNSVGKKMVLY